MQVTPPWVAHVARCQLCELKKDMPKETSTVYKWYINNYDMDYLWIIYIYKWYNIEIHVDDMDYL